MMAPNSQQTRARSFVPAEADTAHSPKAYREGDDESDEDDKDLDVEQGSSHHFGKRFKRV